MTLPVKLAHNNKAHTGFGVVTWGEEIIGTHTSCLTVILIFFYIAQHRFLFLSSLSCQIQPVHWGALKAAAMLGRSALSLGVTAHRLSKNVTFYINEVASPVSGSQTPTSEQHRPLMLMLPWMGSRPQAVAKYCEIYFRTGFDVLVVETEVRTLWSCDPDIYIMLNTVSGLSNNRTGLLYVRVNGLYCSGSFENANTCILFIVYHSCMQKCLFSGMTFLSRTFTLVLSVNRLLPSIDPHAYIYNCR